MPVGRKVLKGWCEMRIGTHLIGWVILVVLTCTATTAFALPIYGVGSSGVYLVDTETWASQLLFDIFIDWYGATDGYDSTSFFATPDGGSLYQIDVTVQTATAIGTYGGTQICGLAYNESNGILYGIDNSSLYSIDTATGLPTLIGSFGGPDTVWAIDYDESIDELVAVNNTDQSMYYLDMLTGSATIVGSTGQSRITDIWYDPSSGNVFGVGSYPNQLYELNSLTGVATAIGTIDHALMGLGNPIPEPCTFILLSLGSFIAARKRG